MPVYRFQIQSHLTTQAVLDRVRALVRETPGLRAIRSGSLSVGARKVRRPSLGKWKSSEFKCYRDTRCRNSFLPRVAGHVDSDHNGTKIDVTMYLHALVLAFMLFWLGGVGLGAVAALRQGDGGAATLIPIGMFVFGLALTLGGVLCRGNQGASAIGATHCPWLAAGRLLHSDWRGGQVLLVRIGEEGVSLTLGIASGDSSVVSRLPPCRSLGRNRLRRKVHPPTGGAA